MSDSGPGSGPPPGATPGGPAKGTSGDSEEAAAERPGDAQSHLRIIPPDPVPEGAEAPPEPAPPAVERRGPGAPRVRVFSDAEDPALMPLPAMGPGSGGSRIDAEDDDFTPATTGPEPADDDDGDVPVVDVAAIEGPDADAGDLEAAPDGEALDEAAPDGGAGRGAGTDLEPHTEEPTTVDSAPLVAGREDAPEVPVDDDATATQTMERATPPEGEEPAPAAGVPGLRLDRSDTGEIIKVSPDSIQRGGDGAATVATEPGTARDADRDAAQATPGPAASAPATYSRRPSPLVKVATGLAFGLVAIVVILLGRPAFAALTGILIVWSAIEFYGALYQSLADGEQTLAGSPAGDGQAAESAAPAASALMRRPAAVVGVAAVAALAVTSFFFGVEATGAVAAGALVAVLVWFVPGAVGPTPPRDAAFSALAIVHVGVAGAFAMLILRLEHGFALLLIVVILTVVSDVAAYGWGASVGRTPFFASVSPNKTLEGFVGAVATTIVAGFVIAGLHGWLYPSVPVVASWGQVLLLSTLVAVFATAGDLAESLFKRDLGIKDVASFLPGHGGMMDRLDGMIFALPVAYLFLRTMGLADVG